MKCKRKDCANQALPERWYCCRSCAPYGHFTGEGRTKSGNRTKRYSTGGTGERSPTSSRERSRSPYAIDRIQNTDKNIKRVSETTTCETESISKSRTESDGDHSTPSLPKESIKEEMLAELKIQKPKDRKNDLIMLKTEINDCEPSIMEEKRETQLTDLRQSSINIDLVTSDTMNLLKESTKHLRDLMLSNKHKPQVVCQCASEIHKLVRLKLDILRDARRTFK